MLDLMKRVLVRRRDDRGASAVEYGLLVAAIAAVIAAIAFLLGSTIQSNLQDTCNDIAAGPGGVQEDCAAPPPAGG